MRPAGSVVAPPNHFNLAHYVIELNAARKTKTAYIDDRHELTYAELALAVRRFASGCVSSMFAVKSRTCPWRILIHGAVGV